MTHHMLPRHVAQDDEIPGVPAVRTGGARAAAFVGEFHTYAVADPIELAARRQIPLCRRCGGQVLGGECLQCARKAK